MKTSSLRLLLPHLFMLLTGLVLAPVHATTVLTGDYEIEAGMSDAGDLSIAGALHVSASSIDFGTTSGSFQAVQFGYDGTLTPPLISFDATEAAVRLVWRQDLVEKMSLSDGNELWIYAPGYNPLSPNAGAIRLDPNLPGSGGSAMYVDGQRVLTLADSASFVSSSSASVTGNLAAGRLTVGSTLTSSGTNISVGDSSFASSDSIGVLGSGSQATGPASLAMGASVTASGYNSLATGHVTTASGRISFASGIYTHAQGWAQFVVGANNVWEGTGGNSPALTEPVFIVGNGSSQVPSLQPNPGLSNAFVVRWNGKAEVGGDLLVKKNAVMQGAINGTTANFSGRVRLEPAGGISMGEFTHDPEDPGL